ncbi:MAG: PH domain-containing protein [Candidatus Hadarchaeota archaeon]
MQKIEKILDKNEKVIWVRKPKFAPFVCGAFISTPNHGVCLGFTVLAGVVGVLAMIFGLIQFSLAIFLVGVLLVIVASTSVLLIYMRVYYALSNKRAIIQTGVISSDFKTVQYNKVSNTKLTAGFWDKIFGTGSVLIYAPAEAWTSEYLKKDTIVYPLSFYHIPNPNEAYNIFRKFVSHE